MIATGKQLAESIFGQDVVDRDWPGYEFSVTEFEAGEDPSVIGFVGLTKRAIALDDATESVAGIGFVCVAGEHRGQGLATKMMRSAHWYSSERLKLPFALLNAGFPTIYQRIGYRHAPNLPDGWYVCELGERRWDDEAQVDLRGSW